MASALFQRILIHIRNERILFFHTRTGKKEEKGHTQTHTKKCVAINAHEISYMLSVGMDACCQHRHSYHLHIFCVCYQNILYENVSSEINIERGWQLRLQWMERSIA